jgi:glycosyltransferase involved in cell wall biosynthesis
LFIPRTTGGIDAVLTKQQAGEPLVSIVVPTFNRSWGLKEAIRSVLAQSYSNFELIIVDDCSNDDTAQIAGQYEADPRVRYYRNDTRLGMVGNWGKGLSLVEGEYFSFLMDDDQLRPDFLKSRVQEFIQDSTLGVVFSNYEKQDRFGNSLGFNGGESARQTLDSLGLLQAALSRSWFVGASLYRTALIRSHWSSVAGDDLVLDFSLHIQLSLLPDTKGIYLPSADFLMMEHPGQNSRAKLDKVLVQTEEVLLRIQGLSGISQEQFKLLRKELTYWRVQWGKELLRNGARKEAARKLWSAIRTQPKLMYPWKVLIRSIVSPNSFVEKAV